MQKDVLNELESKIDKLDELIEVMHEDTATIQGLAVKKITDDFDANKVSAHSAAQILSMFATSLDKLHGKRQAYTELYARLAQPGALSHTIDASTEDEDDDENYKARHANKAVETMMVRLQKRIEADKKPADA